MKINLFFNMIRHKLFNPLNRLLYLYLLAFLVGCGQPIQASRDAAADGNLKSVKRAVESGADINNPDPMNGYTPLHLAVANDHKDVVKYLVDNKAKINILNKRKETPLDLSTTEATDKFLEKHGAKRAAELD